MRIRRKKYPYMKEVLYYATVDNGLTVTFLPKTDFKETYGILTTEFGALHTHFKKKGQEFSYPEGIAHFLEHKLFETADEDDVMNLFADLGASANAYTSLRQTSYLFSTTENVLECLALLQQFVREPHFTAENVYKEQGIIGQEIEMYQDDADYRLYTGILSSLYPETALAHDIAGTIESIKAVTAEDLYENFEAFYHPSKMSLFVIGNFDVKKVWKQVKTFQLAQNDTEIEPIEHLPVKKLDILKNRTEYFEVASPKLALGLRGNDSISLVNLPSYRISLQLLFAMLFGWTSQRYQTLYDQGKIDSSFHFQVEVTPDYHHVIFSADTKEPISLSASLRKAVSRFAKDPDVSEEHLALLKKEMYGDFIRSLNSLEFTASHFVANSLEGASIFDLPQLIESIGLQDVLEVGQAFIENCDMTDYMIFPK
ncbi:EF-P 5-aminopentanol modification-associated protein YfmH [Streptococcus suis]